MFYEPEKNSAKQLLEALGVAREHFDKSYEISTKKQDKKSELRKKYVNTEKIIKMIRRELLSRPNCRRLQSQPNPNVQSNVGVGGAAVKQEFWSRLDYLAEPRKEKINFETYYHPTSREKSRKNERKKKIVSERLNELSRPKSFIDMEEKIERKRFENKEAWTAHLEKLKIFGAARKTPPSPLPPERIKKPLNKILPHLENLSKPVNRSSNNEKTYEELYTVKRSALKYVANNRIQELAAPRPLNEEAILDMNYDPYTKLLNAKKYVASERIKQLAKPIIRIAPKETDIKSDAYKVNPKALKAWCSPRIKKLAQHIVRN